MQRYSHRLGRSRPGNGVSHCDLGRMLCPGLIFPARCLLAGLLGASSGGANLAPERDSKGKVNSCLSSLNAALVLSGLQGDRSPLGARLRAHRRAPPDYLVWCQAGKSPGSRRAAPGRQEEKGG